MKLADGHIKALVELLEIFGLQHKRVISLTLNATGNDLVMLTAKFYVHEEEMDETAELFKRYELVEREEDGSNKETENSAGEV